MSLWKKQIDAVLDIMENPPFVCIGTGNGQYPYAVMEQTKAPELCVNDAQIDAMTTYYHEQFRDKRTAIFCRNTKNAEALVNAVMDCSMEMQMMDHPNNIKE